MKRLFASVGTLVLLGCLSLHAAPQTNLVQVLHFHLSVDLPGATSTNQDLVGYSITSQKIFTVDIIQAIGTSMSRQFSANASLLAVTSLSGGPSAVVIQDGTNRVDVTGFFVINKDTTAVDRGILDTTTGFERGTECVNRSFRLRNRGGFPNLTVNFTVSGLSATKYKSLLDDQGAVIGVADEYVMSVVGTAQVNGASAVIHGAVSNIGRTVEVR